VAEALQAGPLPIVDKVRTVRVPVEHERPDRSNVNTGIGAT
jgi:hypothetical protein